MEGNFATAIGLTTIAGLATGIGGVLAIVGRKPGPRFMGFTLGFSAGVMVFISFAELLTHGTEMADGTPILADLEKYGAFLLGMTLFFLADLLVPHDCIGHHEHDRVGEGGHGGEGGRAREGRLMRAGLMVALGIGIHNFPEGLATFAGSIHGTHLGLAIGGAMALHNIPEGLAVAAPVYAATGSRRRAFGWSLLSGLSEPAGAALAALVLWPILTPAVLAWFTAGVAGVMVAVAMDELVPTAKEFGSDHAPILGVITGMALMAVGLHLLHSGIGMHGH